MPAWRPASTTPWPASPNLLAVAVLPVIAGITGDRFYDSAAMTHGFHIAMPTLAALAAAGGVLAWLTIGNDALAAEPERRGEPPVAVPTDYSCSVADPPWRSAGGYAPAAQAALPTNSAATEA